MADKAVASSVKGGVIRQTFYGRQYRDAFGLRKNELGGGGGRSRNQSTVAENDAAKKAADIKNQQDILIKQAKAEAQAAKLKADLDLRNALKQGASREQVQGIKDNLNKTINNIAVNTAQGIDLIASGKYNQSTILGNQKSQLPEGQNMTPVGKGDIPLAVRVKGNPIKTIPEVLERSPEIFGKAIQKNAQKILDQFDKTNIGKVKLRLEGAGAIPQRGTINTAPTPENTPRFGGTSKYPNEPTSSLISETAGKLSETGIYLTEVGAVATSAGILLKPFLNTGEFVEDFVQSPVKEGTKFGLAALGLGFVGSKVIKGSSSAAKKITQEEIAGKPINVIGSEKEKFVRESLRLLGDKESSYFGERVVTTGTNVYDIPLTNGGRYRVVELTKSIIPEAGAAETADKVFLRFELKPQLNRFGNPTGKFIDKVTGVGATQEVARGGISEAYTQAVLFREQKSPYLSKLLNEVKGTKAQGEVIDIIERVKQIGSKRVGNVSLERSQATARILSRDLTKLELVNKAVALGKKIDSGAKINLNEIKNIFNLDRLSKGLKPFTEEQFVRASDGLVVDSTVGRIIGKYTKTTAEGIKNEFEFNFLNMKRKNQFGGKIKIASETVKEVPKKLYYFEKKFKAGPFGVKSLEKNTFAIREKNNAIKLLDKKAASRAKIAAREARAAEIRSQYPQQLEKVKLREAPRGITNRQFANNINKLNKIRTSRPSASVIAAVTAKTSRIPKSRFGLLTKASTGAKAISRTGLARLKESERISDLPKAVGGGGKFSGFHSANPTFGTGGDLRSYEEIEYTRSPITKGESGTRTILQPKFKTITTETNTLGSRFIQATKTSQRNRLELQSRFKQPQALRPAQAQGNALRQGQRQDQALRQEQQQKQRSRSRSRDQTKIREAPTIRFPPADFPESQTKKKKFGSKPLGKFKKYDAFVKRKGREVRVTATPTTKKAALGKALKTADTTLAASAYIKESSRPGFKRDVASERLARSLRYKFGASKRSSNILVEKSKFRLEKRGRTPETREIKSYKAFRGRKR